MGSKLSTKLLKVSVKQHLHTIWAEYTFRNTETRYTVFFNQKYECYYVHTSESLYVSDDNTVIVGDVSMPSFLIERILKSFHGTTVREFLDFWKEFNQKYPKRDLVAEYLKRNR